MKKVSFIAIVHFLTNAVFAVKNEVVEITGDLAYKSVGNKFTLSQMNLTINEELRNLQRNIFTTITGRIANLLHMNRELCSAVRTSGYLSAKLADKLFNLHIVINVDGVEQVYNLNEIVLGKDSLATAGNIYANMVETLTGQTDLFDRGTTRTENLEVLQQMLAPFGVTAKDCITERTDILVGAVTDQVKTVNSYRKVKMQNFALNAGMADVKKETIRLREQNELLLGKSTIPANEKKALADAKPATAEPVGEIPAPVSAEV